MINNVHALMHAPRNWLCRSGMSTRLKLHSIPPSEPVVSFFEPLRGHLPRPARSTLPSSASRTKNLSTQHTTPSHLFDLAALIAFTAAATLILCPLNQSSPLNLAAMEPDTRATTSFEKDSSKTKDTNPKGKSRSSSLLMISSGFTFLAALPQQRSSTSSSFRSSSFR
ncbi:hypothetical protein FALBO_10939 [Fusarium albosuccineum]|uniref:Uncharacterized protein n=1 Tax=Fusarium albosuccineum TaxID=1237068 RepID=A0A8H4P9C8_9HYPO|nr:hypothetical protein FALBO_10939 [Fusarium albosuccineum]